MKHVFDSRDFLASANTERRAAGMRPDVRDAPAQDGKVPQWMTASLARTVIVTLAIGAMLYFVFENEFLSRLGNCVLAALFVPLLSELVAGLLRRKNVQRVSGVRAIAACDRKYVKFACFAHLLLAAVLAAFIAIGFWNGRSKSGADVAKVSDGQPAGAPAETAPEPEAPCSGRLAKAGAAKVSPGQIKAYLTPSDAEVEQLYQMVVAAPFVAENLQYRDRLANIPFVYIATNDVVNASSLRNVVEKNGEKSLVFHTVLFGGAARYARLVGLAAALQDSGRGDMLKKFVAAMPKRFCGVCDEESCEKFITDNGLDEALADEKIRLRAVSYSSGTIISILAHECGHHALGHLLGFPRKENLSIDRNQEREADSFASSVISASPFGEFIFAGTLFWHYAVAMQSEDGRSVAGDHPHSRERFENFVKSNREKAAAMGITLE